MALRILLRRETCIGSENCVRAAPHTFDTREGQVVLLNRSGDSDASIREAAGACPVGAIVLSKASEDGI